MIPAKAHASLASILPLATGLLAVRFIKASVLRSKIWLMALDDPVTNIPPAKSKRTCPRSKLTLGARR